MTIEELLNTNVPLPLSRHGTGTIRYCDLEDLKSAKWCVENDPNRYQMVNAIMPMIDRLIYRLKRDVAANVCEDLRYFALKTAISGPKTSNRLRKLHAA